MTAESTASVSLPGDAVLIELDVAPVDDVAPHAAEPADAVQDEPATPAPVPERQAEPALTRRARRARRTSEPAVEQLVVDEVPAPAAQTTAHDPAAVDPELLESVVDSAAAESLVDADAPADGPVEDEFERAARLFCFTGETPVAAAATAGSTPLTITGAHVVPTRGRRSGRSAFRRVATASFSVGVFGIVGLMAVGMTTPAEAVAAASTPTSAVAPANMTVSSSAIDPDEIQAYVAPSTAENDSLERTESYSTQTIAELASESGIQNFSNFFYNDPNGEIQWPFPVGVSISYGFGMRSGSMHEGLDFVPGDGAPIQAITDGVVRVATSAGGAYGVHVIIDHEIDGQLVSSHYAHMQYDSLQVEPGDTVTAGTIIGLTGNTGRSFGAHLHFEILMNGTTAIDPLPWLREHAGG
ncbi:peptidoglycan DD-metalloendopeptidase family protein [Microbacterium sp. NPDC077184]|uniref:M23 family metallopeptidase n=1 Tax=Microbacterium sp. NPDC077184 TaxID=3154764 RepID=UPI00343C9423